VLTFEKVGIHERAGRSKIFDTKTAHILNDETQRKCEYKCGLVVVM
jgi:hypothetical protein